MIEFTISSTQIIAICSLLTALWGVYKIVKELKKPNADLKKKVDAHETRLNSDNERLKAIEDADRMMLQSLLVIINHEITGNGIETMKQTRDEIDEFLINK